MNTPFPLRFPAAALVVAIIQLTYEHLTGGVQSHHVLNRADLPEISNWLGLLTLPLVGAILGWRVRAHQRLNATSGGPTRVMPRSLLVPLLGALAWALVMALSFEFDVGGVTRTAFYGLFACALLLPVYRAEYIMGFVLGMTFTFGGVLPVIIASIIATFSFVVRAAVGRVVNLARPVNAFKSGPRA